MSKTVTMREAFDSVMNDFKESMKPDGMLFAQMKKAVESLQNDRIKELEEKVRNLEGSPSPHNTYVPLSCGPVDDGATDNGFM